MVGYTEVLQTIAAMFLFSLILLNSNRMIQRNNIMQVEGELEQETIAIAQDVIEEARTKEFDQITVDNSLPPVNIPADFTNPTSLGTDGETTRDTFNDFDDYHGWNESVETEHGVFDVTVAVYYVSSTTYEKTTSETAFKKIEVTVTSKYLKKRDLDERKEYVFEFIRNYYAD